MHLVARIDLSHLARHLKGSGRHPSLVKAIERASSAGSILEDLRNARASLDQIAQIQGAADAGSANTHGWFNETTITGALFVQAIVIYARATATSGDRMPLLGQAKLTEDQRATHNEAIDYRNKAIAHFGRGEAFADGPLIQEAVVLSVYSDNGRTNKQIGAYTTRAQNKTAFSERLSDLINVRMAEVDARYQALFDAADKELEKTRIADPELRRALPDFEFDIEKFCASPEAAAQLRAQFDAGIIDQIDYVVRVPKL